MNYESRLTNVELRALNRLKSFYQKETNEGLALTIDEQCILTSLKKILRSQEMIFGLQDYVKEQLRKLKNENSGMGGAMNYQKGRFDALKEMNDYLKR